MSNKSLRILIADTQHFNRLRIERLFNLLGYFRVAPVQSLEELLRLVEYGSQPLDLVVVNGALAGGSLNLRSFFADNAQVRQAFIFNAQQSPLPAAEGRVQVSHLVLPDWVAISQLMSAVDQRLPFVGTVISVR